MTDWTRIERVLDDRTNAHACAFCGGAILIGDTERWSLAVRRSDGATSVVWIHASCFIDELHPHTKKAFLTGGPAAPPA